MKLSELVTHTSDWVGVPRTVVESHARYLREAGLLTTGGRGLAASEMNDDDKVRLLISVCGTSVASDAAARLNDWLNCQSVEVVQSDAPFRFEFPTKSTLPSALIAFFKRDLQSAEMKAWKSGERFEKPRGAQFQATSDMLSLIFVIDSIRANINLQRVAVVDSKIEAKQTISNRFALTLDFSKPLPIGRKENYRAKAEFTCQLSEENLIGWSGCFDE
ncbi:hypothetical protein [Bradyrhizobium sp. CCBAU 25338]|uniref:hypothetical protein n=1 Tax=Bradyrhizobium sp. CCBAU 25338 TaxID=1641877 RepID=UPI002302F41B|nr:hypothetical protein [Bradyrhizobium sp. CCBAU 25338]